MSLSEKAQDVIAQIKSLMQDDDGWKTAKKGKDVMVYYKKASDWSGHVYKADCTLHADPETVYKYVEPNPDGPRKKWDKAIKDIEIVEDVDKDIKVVRTITQSYAGGLIAPRDFVDVVVKVETDNYIATNGFAVDHPECPAVSQYIRGTNYPCAIICNKVAGEANNTLVTTITQSNIGGMVPRALVESALPSNQVDFMHCLKKALQDDGHLHGE